MIFVSSIDSSIDSNTRFLFNGYDSRIFFASCMLFTCQMSMLQPFQNEKPAVTNDLLKSLFYFFDSDILKSITLLSTLHILRYMYLSSIKKSSHNSISNYHEYIALFILCGFIFKIKKRRTVHSSHILITQ